MFNALNIIADWEQVLRPMSNAPTSFLKCSPNVTHWKQALSPDQYMGCLFVERYWRCIGWDKNVFVSFSGSSCKRASGNSSSRGISARYLWDTKPSTIIYIARHIVQNPLQEIFKREDNSRQRSWQQFICWIAETWEEEKNKYISQSLHNLENIFPLCMFWTCAMCKPLGILQLSTNVPL